MNTPLSSLQARMQQLTRRAFLGRSAQGLGALALGSLINPQLHAATSAGSVPDKWAGVVQPAHFPPCLLYTSDAADE